MEVLREISWEVEIVRRVQYANAHPKEMVSLEKFLGKERYEELLKMNPDDILDENLFE